MHGPLSHNPVPATGSRNITVPLAAWLRKMGFRTLEQGGVAPTSLTATWEEGSDWLYGLHYTFTAGMGALRLVRSARHKSHHDVLVDNALVHRLREARFLLLSSTRYAAARQAALAAGTLLPAHAHPPTP